MHLVDFEPLYPSGAQDGSVALLEKLVWQMLPSSQPAGKAKAGWLQPPLYLVRLPGGSEAARPINPHLPLQIGVQVGRWEN